MKTDWAMFPTRFRVILVSACQHNQDQGIESIFDSMSETNFNPNLAMPKENVPPPSRSL